eukprot:12397821-Karenia_brevis.AAC.1
MRVATVVSYVWQSRLRIKERPAQMRRAWRGARGARGALMLMCIALHKKSPVHSIAMATVVHNADAPRPAR